MAKWYSNGLTEASAKDAEKNYAKIENPTYGITDRAILALQFTLKYASGGQTMWQLSRERDIREILTRTNSTDISELEGVVVEAYVRESLLRGLSVNENLVRTER